MFGRKFKVVEKVAGIISRHGFRQKSPFTARLAKFWVTLQMMKLAKFLSVNTKNQSYRENFGDHFYIFNILFSKKWVATTLGLSVQCWYSHIQYLTHKTLRGTAYVSHKTKQNMCLDISYEEKMILKGTYCTILKQIFALQMTGTNLELILVEKLLQIRL